MPEVTLGSQPSSTIRTIGASVARPDWLWIGTVAFFAACLVLNLWLGSALVPATQADAAESHRLLTWHAWLMQFAALLLGLLMLLAGKARFALSAFWTSASPTVKAATLCAPLLALELFFAAGFWYTRERPVSELGYLRAFFWLGREFNPPTIFGALQLAALSALAWACYTELRSRGARRYAYAISALLALYMSVDELLMLHERVGYWLQANVFSTGGSDTVSLGPLQVYGWTILYGPLALLCGAVLARLFWRDLHADGSLLLLCMAGAIFVAGSVGMETLNSHGIASGWHAASSAAEHAYVLAEETMEMVAVTLAVFVFARCLFRLKATLKR